MGNGAVIMAVPHTHTQSIKRCPVSHDIDWWCEHLSADVGIIKILRRSLTATLLDYRAPDQLSESRIETIMGLLKPGPARTNGNVPFLSVRRTA